MVSLFGVSVITVAVLYGILGAVLIAVGLAAGWAIWPMLVALIVLVLIQYAISPWLTDLTQRWFYKTNFEVELPAYLDEFIKQVCDEQNMNYPKIGYINDGAPNAFTYGHTKNDARVVLTRGLFELLTPDEVKAVVAHELGHAVHYDMLLMTMVQLVPMVLYAVYDVCMQAARTRSGGNNNKGKEATVIIALVAYILYIICQYIILWLSRVREYYADEFSARTMKSGNLLASALVNIGFGLSTRSAAANAKSGVDMDGRAAKSNTLGVFDAKASKSLVVNCYDDGKINPAFIKNAMRWELWNVWAFWYQLGSTHPLISKRIQALGRISQELGEVPLVVFDEEKPESYVDDFLRELVIDILPWVILFVGAGLSLLVADAQMWLWLCSTAIVAVLASIFKYAYIHPNKEYHEANVAGLLGEVKVSMIKSIPCQLVGTIIGRGNPGCIFNEDYVIKDPTGIMFLDYNQPLWIINKIFALFKSPENFDKQVEVKGWYRRNMVPFMELYSYTIDGKTKKCFGYGFGWIMRFVLLAAAVLGLVMTLMG